MKAFATRVLRHLLVAGAFAFLSTSFAAHARAESPAATDLATANAAIDRKDDDAAKPILARLATGPTATAEERDVAARASFLLATLDERLRDYPSAMTHYRAVLTIDPGNWFASTARARLEALAPYDADFASLERLDAIRKDPARANDPAAIDALARELQEFPSGNARREGYLFVAQAYLGRLQRPRDAVAPALSVAHDRTAPLIQRQSAFDVAHAALMAIGALDEAARVIGDDPDAPPWLRKTIRRDLRRRTLHVGSTRLLFLGGGIGLAALVIAARRQRLRITGRALVNPHALAIVGVLVGLGYLIAQQWEDGDGKPFLGFGVVLLGVHVLVASLRGALADRGRVLRVSSALVVAACVLAGAYLVLERGQAHGASYLEGFGL